MNHSKESSAPGWVVARLRRKLRQALSEQEELRARLAIRARQVVELTQELTREKKRAESVCEFWENQANAHFEAELAAHRIIGGLRYYLEQAGVTIPEHLK